jgi:DNA helicase-2/ATP-dependent DNA helicase PcrA
LSKLSGITNFLFQDKSVEGISRYENLQELLNSIQEYVESRSELLNSDGSKAETDLNTYLQEVSLLSSMDENDDEEEKASLMTIHSAKGLEFKNVYVAGMEEELFPSALSLNDRHGLEEERRLFYVAVTRAEKHLSLSYAQTRYRFGSLIHSKPSRFLEEIDQNNFTFPLKRQSEEANFNNWGKSSFGSKSTFSKESRKWSKTNVKNTKKTQAINKPLPKKTTKAKIDLSNFKASNPLEIQTGMSVLHQKFGQGKVISMDGTDSNRIANIFFPESGNKKIMLKYAKIQIIS